MWTPSDSDDKKIDSQECGLGAVVELYFKIFSWQLQGNDRGEHRSNSLTFHSVRILARLPLNSPARINPDCHPQKLPFFLV